MQMTMSFLPELSNPMSLLAVYVFLMMCCSVFINVACILMLRIYHKPEDEKVISCLIITCNSLIQFASPNNSLITFSYIMSFKSFIFTQFDFNSVHTQLMPLFIMCIFACLNKVNYPIYREMSDELQVPQWMQKVVRVVGCQICRCCDKDPNSDLPEITWPDVGRTLDFFFFIAFIAGQSALTFFFLVPLATRYWWQPWHCVIWYFYENIVQNKRDFLIACTNLDIFTTCLFSFMLQSIKTTFNWCFAFVHKPSCHL